LTGVSLPRLLYEDNSLGIFVLVTMVLGGGASWLTGRAIAQTWRPIWHAVAYTLILGAAVRFIYYSLFDGTLLSLHYYLVDSIICMIAGLISYRATRVRQMVTQYRWINEPDGPLRWRHKLN
jgi:hypothetical protein